MVRHMQATAVCDVAQAVLREFFPRHIGRIRVRYFKDGVLYCDVPSSVLAAEIRLQEKALITAIHERLGPKRSIIDRIAVC